jgi:ribose transport system permease protein
MSAVDVADAPTRRRLWDRFRNSPFSIQNISLVYVAIALFVLFSLWIPDTFLTATTWETLAAGQAVTTILALAVVVALASGAFDLSVAAVLGAASIWIAHLMADLHWAPVPAALATLLGAALVGVISATAVVVFRISSFIATLAMSSILAAFVTAVSGNQEIIGLPTSFGNWATFQLLGIQGAFWIALGLALLVWFVLEHRPIGRHLYATGGNADSARLAGVRTSRVLFGTLVCAALIAGIAGIVVTARIGTGSPTIGPPYLLPAYAAAFLGSTQVKPGRFNVLGTLIAVYTLGMSVQGLELAGAPLWLPDLFNGVALLVAVGLSVWRRRS